MRKTFYSLLFILFSFSMSAFAQNNVIRYVWDAQKRDVLRKVEFVSPKLDKVVKTINVFDQNPFNHYKFPVVPDSSQNKVYDLNGVSMFQIFADSVYSSRPDWKKIREWGLVQGSSTSAWITDNPSFIVLYYTFKTYVLEGSLIGMTAVYVFDRDGKCILKDIQPQQAILQLYFTPSGRFLAYTTGKYVEDRISMPSGFRLFDLKSPIYSWFEKDYNPGLYFLPDEKLMSVTDNQANDTTRKYFYKIIDIPAKKMYTKTFLPDDMSRIINISSEAIVFKDNTRAFYKTDFKVQDLK